MKLRLTSLIMLLYAVMTTSYANYDRTHIGLIKIEDRKLVMPENPFHQLKRKQKLSFEIIEASEIRQSGTKNRSMIGYLIAPNLGHWHLSNNYRKNSPQLSSFYMSSIFNSPDVNKEELFTLSLFLGSLFSRRLNVESAQIVIDGEKEELTYKAFRVHLKKKNLKTIITSLQEEKEVMLHVNLVSKWKKLPYKAIVKLNLEDVSLKDWVEDFVRPCYSYFRSLGFTSINKCKKTLAEQANSEYSKL